MLPTPLLQGDRIRVFHTGCDADGRGRPGWVDLAAEDPTRVVDQCTAPLLEIGAPGHFDDSGVVATSILRVPDGRLFMYYVGFELGVSTRYRLLTGLATSEDGGLTFRRHQRVPVLERSESESAFRCGPHVRLEAGKFLMHYIAGDGWTDVGGKQVPVYGIVAAESPDGIRWPDAGRRILDPQGPDEHGLSRPWIVRRPDRLQLHFSVRSRSAAGYVPGLAESTDGGANWQRRAPEAGMECGPDPFDARGFMYAAIIDACGSTYCFYNGNDFGREGFAVARMEAR